MKNTRLKTLANLCSLLIVFAQPFLLPAQTQYPAADIPPLFLPNAHSVIRFSETVFRVVNTSEAEVEETRVVTILDDKGEGANIIVEGESAFQKVKTLKARLFDTNGKLVSESSKKDIVETTSDWKGYDGDRLKWLQMTHHQYPYTVEFTSRKTIKGFFTIGDFMLQRIGQSVVETTYRLVAPNDYKFSWKGVNTDIQPQVTAEDGKTTWAWTARHLPALPYESFSPYSGGIYSGIMFAPAQVRIDGREGNFSDWKNVGQFFYDLNKDRDNLSPAMQETVRRITGGLQTNREKIAALYRYLQTNHRYVSIQIGIGGWQTFDASFVESKKYGDCKALSNYMKALLKAAGITAYQASVFASTDGAPEIWDDFPAPAFNHVILYVPSEDLWLECTSSTHPMGYLGEFTANRRVLLRTPEGGRLVRTPALTPAENFQKNKTDIVLDENGQAVIRGYFLSGGAEHELDRKLAAQKSQQEIEKYFAGNVGFSIVKLHQLSITASESRPESETNYQLDAMNYAVRSGKRMFVPLMKTNPLGRSLPADEQRQLALHIPNGYTFSDTVVLHLPAGYEVENMPAPVNLESEFGSFEMRVEKNAEQITAIRHVVRQPVSVSAERYEVVRQFYQQILKADGVQLVLVKKQQPEPIIGGNK